MFYTTTYEYIKQKYGLSRHRNEYEIKQFPIYNIYHYLYFKKFHTKATHLLSRYYLLCHITISIMWIHDKLTLNLITDVLDNHYLNNLPKDWTAYLLLPLRDKLNRATYLCDKGHRNW